VAFASQFLTRSGGEETMTNIKFVVRVSRGAARAPAYEQRIDPSPVQMTTNRRRMHTCTSFPRAFLQRILPKALDRSNLEVV
jgi:hypothetical protein